MDMKQHKITSFVLTSIIIVMLVFLGPASAVRLNISDIEDAAQGQDVSFNVDVELTSPDQYLPVKYADLIITGPNNFSETCRVYNDGSLGDCSLDLDVLVNFNVPYGFGHGFGVDYGYGYGYGYGYYFGEGYGYGYAGAYTEGPEISYTVTWHTTSDVNPGDYKVKAKLFAAGEDQYEDYGIYSYCGVMEGMFLEAVVENNFPNGTEHGSDLDLNQDGEVDLTDIVIFSQTEELRNNSTLYGMFKEYFRHRDENGAMNEDLDLNDDGVVDGADIIVYVSEHYQDEAWCAGQIALISEGVEHEFVSGEKSFSILAVQTTVTPTTGGGGNTYTGTTGVRNETNNTEENNGEVVSEESGSNLGTSVAEDNNQQETSNKGLFNTITAAVVGAGEAIGLGETMSYILSLLLVTGIVVGSARVFRKKRN